MIAKTYRPIGDPFSEFQTLEKTKIVGREETEFSCAMHSGSDLFSEGIPIQPGGHYWPDTILPNPAPYAAYKTFFHAELARELFEKYHGTADGNFVYRSAWLPFLFRQTHQWVILRWAVSGINRPGGRYALPTIQGRPKIQELIEENEAVESDLSRLADFIL